MLVMPVNSLQCLKFVEALTRTFCLDSSMSFLQLFCLNYFAYLCQYVVAMVTVCRWICENSVHYGLKQGQITLNIDRKYVLKLL